MSTQHSSIQNISSMKRTFWTVVIIYLLISFEFFYMASPFAIYFYSIYGPGLNFINNNSVLAWLMSIFLAHIVVETSSALLNLHNILGAVLAIIGFLAFCIGAGQVYYYKIFRKGVVMDGIYNFIRHPQYLSLAICSFGLLLLWPRYIVLLSFIAMIFVYYFLAKVEENECEGKFGKSYIEYKNRTGMFLPFRISLMDKLPNLPKLRPKRYLMIITLYIVTSIVAISLANGLKSWSLSSLYALYSKDAVYISITKVDKKILDHIVKIALTNPEVETRLRSKSEGGSTKFINYVLPDGLYVSEIPMNPVEGVEGHHFLSTNYKKDSYKIIFTKAEVRTDQGVTGKEILLNTVKRIPILEVRIDLSQNRVAEIKNPPANIKYENIPLPLY